MIRQGQRPRIAALALLLCLGGGAAFADDFADCNQQKDLDLRIRGCSALMKGTQLPAGDKAVVLQLRGNAFRVKRDFASALSDYVEAMTLADDDTVRRSVEGGIMMTLTQGPPELRKSPNGKRAIDLLEKNFQRSKAARPAPK
jgi:L-aminopeptidase/D-esterase-like protein